MDENLELSPDPIKVDEDPESELNPVEVDENLEPKPNPLDEVEGILWLEPDPLECKTLLSVPAEL